MKVAVILDDDGHFQLAKLRDREEVIKLLELSDEGGDRIESEVQNLGEQDKHLWDNKLIISQYYFDRLMLNFEQRGTFEIIEI